MIRLLLLVGFCLLSGQVCAQPVNRYLIYFTDKLASNYSLDQPEEFLSSRAIERRRHQNIALTELDLPVSPQYLLELKSKGITPFWTSKWLNAVLIQEPESKIEEIESLAFVEKVEYMAPGQRLSARHYSPGTAATLRRFEDDPINITQNQLLGVDQLWQEGYSAQGKLIVVIDDGFQGVDTLSHYSRLYQENRMLATRNFVEGGADVYRLDSHGSMVLSTMAAYRSGEYIGTAPDATYALALTEDINSEYRIEEFNYIAAAEWADSLGADIITTSLGYRYFDDERMNHTLEDLDGNTTLAARAASLAALKGILVVNSVGNSGNSGESSLITPADAHNILAVGAVNAQTRRVNFSSQGPTADNRIKPDICAMGYQVWVVAANGSYRKVNGTSFSAPSIAGFAASLWQKYPQLSSLELRELIINSGTQAKVPDNRYGYGLPQYAEILLANPEGVVINYNLFPNPVRRGQWVNIPEAGNFIIHIQDLQGRSVSGAYFREANGSVKLNTEGMSSGVYLVSLKSNQQSRSFRLLIQ